MTRAEALAAGYLAPQAVARMHSVSARVVYYALACGELASVEPIDSRRRLVPPEAAKAWRTGAPPIATWTGPIGPDLTRAQARGAGCVTPAEAAARRGVSVDTVRRAMKRGELGYFHPFDSDRALIAPATLGAWRAPVEQEAFSAQDIAKRYGFHLETVHRAIRAGKLKAERVGAKGRYRIRLADARAWCAAFLAGAIGDDGAQLRRDLQR